MFNIGDKVVYPSQGIGVIETIEEKEFKGKKENYLTIQLLNNNMKLTLPMSRVEISNMRLISDMKTLDKNLNDLNNYVVETSDFSKNNFKERKITNDQIIKSGNFNEYLELICTLSQQKKENNLNSSEKQMLVNTKKIVIEEISEVKNLTNIEASSLLDTSIVLFN